MDCPTNKKEGGNTGDADRISKNTADIALNTGETNGLSNPQRVFFRFIDCLSWPAGKSPFQYIIELQSKHPEQSVLDSRLSISSALAQNSPNYSMNLNEIACIACDLFGSVEEAWFSYQIYRNKEEGKERFRQSKMPYSPYMPPNKASNHAELICDISKDDRLFFSPGLSFPSPLSVAVKHQFLDMAQKSDWTEALSTAHLSREGCHTVLYKQPASGQERFADYPYLLSSALIQPIPKDRKKGHLLTRNPFFRTAEWAPLVGREECMDKIGEYLTEYPFIPKVNAQLIPEQPKNIEDLEEGVISAIGDENILELIRLSVTGNTDTEKLTCLYDALEEFSGVQAKHNKMFCMSVTYEQPVVDIFELLEHMTGRPCHLLTSKHQIKSNEPATCKCFFFNAAVNQSLKETDRRLITVALAMMRKDGLTHEEAVKKAMRRSSPDLKRPQL